jgi:hypothetical protein
MDKVVKSLNLGRGSKLKAAEVAIVLALGLAAGLLLGYIVMGTAHAIFDIGAEEHYKHDG